jgi:hypothetical protein
MLMRLFEGKKSMNFFFNSWVARCEWGKAEEHVLQEEVSKGMGVAVGFTTWANDSWILKGS